MGRFNTLNNNFIYGEVSPKMFGRSDLKEYNFMCQQVLNSLILKQGGGTRRPGSQYQIKSINSVNITENTRLIPFVFSDGEAYILVLADKGIGINSFGIAMVNISTGMQSYTIVSGLAPSSGQIQNNLFYNTAQGAFFTGGVIGYTSIGEMNQVQFAQSGDILSLVHPNNPPAFITRVGTDQFILSDVFTIRQTYTALRQPYGGSNPNITNLLSPSAVPSPTDVWSCLEYTSLITNTGQTISLATNNVGSKNTITWASPTSTQYPDGTMIRIDGGGTTGFGYLTDTGTKLFLLRAVAATSTAYAFQLSMWNTLYGWPQTNLFYQQRLMFGGNLQFPCTIWGSQQGDFILHMTVRTLDDTNLTSVSNDRPYNVTIAQDKNSAIYWMNADIDLYIGTQSDEWIGIGTDGSTSLGPLNISFGRQTSYGSEPISAIASDGAMQFVQRGGQGLREIIYVFQQNHRVANPLSDWSEHLLRKGLNLRASYAQPKIVQMAYQALEHNITWCLDSNGFVFGLTRDRSNNVMAWHWHQFGGTDNTNEPPTVISICAAPSKNADSDEIWMVVERVVNGSTVVFIEKMGKPYRFNSMVNSSTDIQDKIVLSDAAVLQRLGSPGNTFNGFGHLPNTTLDVLADGNYMGQITTDGSGNLVLPGPTTYTEVIAGLPFTAIIQGMPEVGGAMQGTGDSTIKRIDRIKMRFERTVQASFGKTNDASLQAISFRDQSVQNGTPTPMFTGVQDLMFGGPYENDADWMVVSTQCLPFTLTSAALRGLTYEG